MDQKNILKMEGGVLYLKLLEAFHSHSMEIHCTMARVSRTGVLVVKADSKGEVSSTSMELTSQESAILVEGIEIVRKFWEEDVLPEAHVLLTCGCVHPWGEHMNDYRHEQDEYQPHKDDRVWCNEHEEAHVYRFNVVDFANGELHRLPF